MIWDIWTENVKLGNWTNQGLCKPSEKYDRCITNMIGIIQQRRSCKNGRLNKCKDYELQRNVSCNASDGSSVFPCVGKKKDKKFQKKFFAYPVFSYTQNYVFTFRRKSKQSSEDTFISLSECNQIPCHVCVDTKHYEPSK